LSILIRKAIPIVRAAAATGAAVAGR